MKDVCIYRSCTKQFLHPISLCLIIISLSICSVTLGLDSNDADIITLSSVFFFFFSLYFGEVLRPPYFVLTRVILSFESRK